MRGLHDLVGYRMLGRQGELGLVVDAERMHAESDEAIVVRGGVSDGLLYRVPAARVVAISHETATVSADVDVADFVPSFGGDGTVELRIG